ncbi:hypothetical protein M0872_003414 [Salmonella enterica]|nr:hypothetical protein [Salmonella enterica]
MSTVISTPVHVPVGIRGIGGNELCQRHFATVYAVGIDAQFKTPQILRLPGPDSESAPYFPGRFTDILPATVLAIFPIASTVAGKQQEQVMLKWSALQPKHGVFHPLLHGALRVKKLPVVVQTALLLVVSSGLSIQPRQVITAGLRLVIPHKGRTHL